MPPIPSWSAMHPILVHFPIALLLTAPVLILLALSVPRAWKSLGLAALTTLTLGAAGTILAASSGDAAENAAKSVSAASATFHQHEELGELTRNAFIILAAVFATILAVSALLPRIGRRVFAIATVLFLLLYTPGAVLLINTAHQGGLLVHQYGVHAPLSGGAAPSGMPASDGDADD